MTFTGKQADPPDQMSLSARLAWKYFFENGWAIVRTEDGVYIVMDEACELETAHVYPDEESLLVWLEDTTSRIMEDDPEDFLRNFVTVPELASEGFVEVLKDMLDAERPKE